MKLYCYEICNDNESSNVNRAIGLSETSGTKRVKTVKITSDESSRFFDEDLTLSQATNQGDIPLFTEIGRMAFKSAIEDVATTYVNGPFYVKEVPVELSENALKRIKNTDEYQIRVPNELYEQLKAYRYMTGE